MSNICVDAMGGDNAPFEIIKGVVETIKNHDVIVTLVGKEDIINDELSKYDYPKERIYVVNASEVIENEDSPTSAIRRKKDSSMVVGMKLLKDKKVDAFVTAGNTGATLTGATLIVGRIKGIDRPALAPVLPNKIGQSILIDCGANVECKPLNLKQFGIMGSCYMKGFYDIKSPKVGLINVGVEEKKGTPMIKESFDLLKESGLDFYGNIEGRDIPEGYVDVLVCDGFTGNVTLKLMEGMGLFMFDSIKDVFLKNLKTKIAALLVKKDLKTFAKKFDHNEHGGSPFLGVDGIVLKSHGSSKYKSIYHTILQADRLLKKDLVGLIKSSIDEMDN